MKNLHTECPIVISRMIPIQLIGRVLLDTLYNLVFTKEFAIVENIRQEICTQKLESYYSCGYYVQKTPVNQVSLTLSADIWSVMVWLQSQLLNLSSRQTSRILSTITDSLLFTSRKLMTYNWNLNGMFNRLKVCITNVWQIFENFLKWKLFAIYRSTDQQRYLCVHLCILYIYIKLKLLQ